MSYRNDQLDCSWSQTAEALQCPPRASIHYFVLSLSQERARLYDLFSHSMDTYHISCGLSFMPFIHFSQAYTDSFSAPLPWLRPGIDPFIGHPSRTRNMPVYRVPFIYTPIHRDTTTSMARGPSAKPPHPSSFSIAKRRTLSRYQFTGRNIEDIADFVEALFQSPSCFT